MIKLDEPKYRVRLFLSVDLTGSTDFKARSGQSNLDWLKTFQKFYGEFPTLFARKYEETCNAIPDIGKHEKSNYPKVWKTIGDEIIFVNRVDTITHLGAFVSSFANTLKEFGGFMFDSHQLNTKGNGWIAAFPSPNCSIRLARGVDDPDPMSGKSDHFTEDVEKTVDNEPHKFDFLGKGIDGGFRNARNSTINSFTISPALAYLLCRSKRNTETTKFHCEFQFHEPQKFKGVVGGNMYPIISIDTNRDERQKKISVLQAELLHQPVNADFDKLAEYLGHYIDYHGIEKPALKVAVGVAEVEMPQHYQDFIAEWRIEADKFSATIASEQEAGKSDGDTGEVATIIDDSRSVNKFIRSASSTGSEATEGHGHE